MSVFEVNDETFAAEIRPQGTTLVEFGAVWCPPCKALLPILHELSAEQGDGVRVLKVDCDESPATASRFGVMSMPTVIVFHNGEPVEKLVGLRPKRAYENVLAKYTVTA
ncbi:thiol reductase thioredoxin [Cohnella sp. CFH 77786]|uniref:thioredoxin family protein n=1 Tax=Cohnella sp. CFH 77786 TaxID=2662265 RepID=UPI001C60CC45|nr:thioredoxin family protein [Cohnella sp. CFH 77786]MBW5448577.1 thiol reductase thioredoxin [Cohnella sp. CFH 77786]